MTNEDEKKREGYVPFARKLFQHKFWQEARRYSRAEAWIDLIQMARYKDGTWTCKGVDYPVKRGQVPTTILHLAKRWEWSRGRVKRFLDGLASDRSVNYKCYSKWTLITLLNYRDFNPSRTLNGTSNGHQNDIKRTQTNKGNKDKKVNKTPNAGEANKYFYDTLGNYAIDLASVLQDFEATRKGGKMQPSVIIKIVDSWKPFSGNLLLEAKKEWDKGRYAKEGMKENYFLGICRRLAGQVEFRRRKGLP